MHVLCMSGCLNVISSCVLFVYVFFPFILLFSYFLYVLSVVTTHERQLINDNRFEDLVQEQRRIDCEIDTQVIAVLQGQKNQKMVLIKVGYLKLH